MFDIITPEFEFEFEEINFNPAGCVGLCLYIVIDINCGNFVTVSCLDVSIVVLVSWLVVVLLGVVLEDDCCVLVKVVSRVEFDLYELSIGEEVRTLLLLLPRDDLGLYECFISGGSILRLLPLLSLLSNCRDEVVRRRLCCREGRPSCPPVLSTILYDIHIRHIHIGTIRAMNIASTTQSIHIQQKNTKQSNRRNDERNDP